MTTTLKPVYGTWFNLTNTGLAGLATDVNLLAGWQSGFIDNQAISSIDEQLSAVLKTGTSPTAGTTIEIWIYGSLDDVPTYPSPITGVVGAISLTSTNVKNAGLALAGVITVDGTTGGVYSMSPVSVGSLFGGALPKRWGVFIVHNTGVALGTPQVVSHLGVQYQSV